MRIAFDLDGTLIPSNQAFACGSDQLNYPFRQLFKECLRAGAKKLIRDLAKDHELYIYTTSLRSPIYIKLWLQCFGVSVCKVINQDIHAATVSGTIYEEYTKAPVLFGIDLLIDDSLGVKRECDAIGCYAMIINPNDNNWVCSVRQAIAQLPDQK